MTLKPDVFKAACRSRLVLDLLGEKWALLILHSLADCPKRTSELRRHIDGISEKMLIQTVRDLERHGFVARTAFAEVPPRVEYRLTPLGQQLARLVRNLDRWVERNLFEILDAQQAFDRRPKRRSRAL